MRDEYSFIAVSDLLRNIGEGIGKAHYHVWEHSKPAREVGVLSVKTADVNVSFELSSVGKKDEKDLGLPSLFPVLGAKTFSITQSEETKTFINKATVVLHIVNVMNDDKGNESGRNKKDYGDDVITKVIDPPKEKTDGTKESGGGKKIAEGDDKGNDAGGNKKDYGDDVIIKVIDPPKVKPDEVKVIDADKKVVEEKSKDEIKEIKEKKEGSTTGTILRDTKPDVKKYGDLTKTQLLGKIDELVGNVHKINTLNKNEQGILKDELKKVKQFFNSNKETEAIQLLREISIKYKLRF